MPAKHKCIIAQSAKAADAAGKTGRVNQEAALLACVGSVSLACIGSALLILLCLITASCAHLASPCFACARGIACIWVLLVCVGLLSRLAWCAPVLVPAAALACFAIGGLYTCMHAHQCVCGLAALLRACMLVQQLCTDSHADTASPPFCGRCRCSRAGRPPEGARARSAHGCDGGPEGKRSRSTATPGPRTVAHNW
jgi:hypothetical protein